MVKNNISSFLGRISIISGRWRGRKLLVSLNPYLRPTTNRVRETLFNWLMPVIQDAHCLDCFAGSGALGFEALSRAAASVTFLEQDRAISAQLTRNLQLLNAHHARVITTDSLQWLTQSRSIFDIVFIDPPFRHGIATATVALLEQHHRLSNNAWIYIETEIDSQTPKVPDYWRIYREKFAGQVAYRLYIRCVTIDNNIVTN